MDFILSKNTSISSEKAAIAVEYAISILTRDIKKVVTKSCEDKTQIILYQREHMEAETFLIEVAEELTIYAADDLGFIYGILYISEQFLGIRPFWFWMDQSIEKREIVRIPRGNYESNHPIVKYRGWFLNDEVLIMKWSIDGDPTMPWRMAFEALLRCGGNMVIPGTDKNSKRYRKMASDMGLWIAQHHAEPLGAEMFVRAYPGIKPSYFDHAELFLKLWEEAVKEQKDLNVVWSLGFRGQGDYPFWKDGGGERYDTPAKRGKLVSDLIKKQKELVSKYVKNPVFCTNLYGEIMELYDGGHLELSEDIIRIYADNGYGKMVVRRRDNECTRIASLPKVPEKAGGIYYHVSFYDLQAANHITMLPNSIDFVDRELSNVIEKNAIEYWLINCSNVRPHVYDLDAIRKKWYGLTLSDERQSMEFSKDYYHGDLDIVKCLRTYHEAMIPYGETEDEHAGEQFYNENIRIIVNQFIRDQSVSSVRLQWLTGERPLSEQVKFYCDICEKGVPKLQAYYKECLNISDRLTGDAKLLFDATIHLQSEIHYNCAMGVAMFGKAYEEMLKEDYLEAFLGFGESARWYDRANAAMRGSEHGVWSGYYSNECLTDVKHTGYMVKKMMGIVREFGDNDRHDLWYRMAIYAPEDREVMTLLVNDNHMTDWELFEAFEKKSKIKFREPRKIE